MNTFIILDGGNAVLYKPKLLSSYSIFCMFFDFVTFCSISCEPLFVTLFDISCLSLLKGSLSNERDYESVVMMKMRQAAERQRLIEQMQREDDDDDGRT